MTKQCRVIIGRLLDNSANKPRLVPAIRSQRLGTPLPLWSVYRVAHKAVWIGEVEAADERAAKA
jgi:hypothetical protein